MWISAGVLPKSNMDTGLRVYESDTCPMISPIYSVAKKLTPASLSLQAALVFLLQQNPKSVSVSSY
jgi:hypothetical protein